jgi:hypothetical protein
MTPAKLAQVGLPRAQVSATSYLDQMAADVGHQHITRLAQLRSDLQAQAGGSQAATLQPALQELADAMPQLDFGLLQPRGFLAGLTGKNRDAGGAFVAQFERIDTIGKALAAAVPSVQKAQQPHAAASDRTLVECEVEYRALDGVIDQGARWLQDMRNQLRTRETQAAGDAAALQKVKEDTARCEILVARLKALRAAAAASQQAHQHVRATAQRRAAVTQAVQKALVGELRDWRSSISPVAAAAAEGKLAGLNLDGPREAHDDLRKRLEHLLGDCRQLRTDEEALGRLLGEMDTQLAAAA